MNQRDRLAVELHLATCDYGGSDPSGICDWHRSEADALLARGVRVVDPTDTTGDLAYEAGREDGRVELARRIEERVVSVDADALLLPGQVLAIVREEAER